MTLLDKSQIDNILQTIPRHKFLVIGDCMLDHYVWGDVHRISPEAPVPVVRIDRDSYRLGGACNVALNLRQLGAQVSLLGPMGQDAAGEKLRDLLEAGGIECKKENFLSQVDSIVKTRVVVRNQQLCRLDRETNFSADQIHYIEELLETILPTVAAVVISDYNKGTITQALLNRLIQLKKTYNFFLSVDPKPSHGLNYSGVDLLKPNRQEALQLSHILVAHNEAFPLRAVAQSIFNRHAARYLAITLGKEGIAVLEPNLKGKISPTITQEVFDVSGAGDTTLAALTLAFCSGFPPDVASQFANIAAGLVVGKIGTAFVTPQEILAYVS